MSGESLCVWLHSLLYVYLDVDQDPSQLEKHSLLQGNSLRWCGGVGLCLENVQERHSCLRSFQAQVGHGLHQSTLVVEQVCATSTFVGVFTSEEDVLYQLTAL